MRMAMWMNLGRDFSGLGRATGALKDIARIETLWADTQARFGAGGPFLFGTEFSAADAMFAPVVARFLGWKPEISGKSKAYCAAVRGHPLVTEWYEGAAAEPGEWMIEEYEAAPAN
jgi:glutathione S-transferase